MMTTVSGRSPDGSGYSAEPEPSCTVSAVPVSIPNAARLLGLATLCEDAEGPDRRLDAAIAIALGLPNGRDSGWCNKENGDYWVVDECAERFTSSVDAALALVPKGAHWSVGSNGCALVDGSLSPPDLETPEAATAVLALCAAALRAIAMEARQGGNREDGCHAKHDSAGPKDIAPEQPR